jgi:hypothetical protein
MLRALGGFYGGRAVACADGEIQSARVDPLMLVPRAIKHASRGAPTFPLVRKRGGEGGSASDVDAAWRRRGIKADQKRIGSVIQERTRLDAVVVSQLLLVAQTNDATFAVGCGIVHEIPRQFDWPGMRRIAGERT